MKPYCVLLWALLLLPAVSYAQSNFKPGLVVTLSGDTIRGNVDYQEWGSNPSAINFKGNDGKIKKYTPADISFFSITGIESYQKFTGPISRDETNENRVIGGRDTSHFIGDVFLSILQQGKVINMYSYTDAIKSRFFYSTPADKDIRELIFRIYFNGDSNADKFKGHTTLENTYLQQISAVALQAGVLDDKLQSAMEGAAYNRVTLVEIATKMNGLSKADLVKTRNSDNNSFDWYAGLGVNVTSFKPGGLYQKAGGTDHTSILPKAVLGFSAYVNPNTRRLVFSAELGLTASAYKSLYNNKIYPYEGIRYSFTQYAISITPIVLYNFYNAENFKFYLGAGLDITRYTYGNKVFIAQDGSNATYGLYPFVYSKGNNPVIFKAGFLVKKRFQLNVNYFEPTLTSFDPFFQMQVRTTQVGINYYLSGPK